MAIDQLTEQSPLKIEDQRRRRRGARGRGNARAYPDEERIARGLGWFSIGIGLAEIAAPGAMTRLVGVRGNYPALLRALGLREIAHGIGILANRKPTEWVWSRVGGDVIDLACLGAALLSPSASRTKIAAATAAVVGVTAMDLSVGRKLSRSTGLVTKDGAVRAKRTITVNVSPEEAYRFWRNFENLPRFMPGLESVQVLDAARSHWRAKGPGGTIIEWDAEITEDRPNELIAWRTAENADVRHRGSVRFTPAPGGRGAIIAVEMQYYLPGGEISAVLAKLFGEEPGQRIAEDLRRFQQTLETGEPVRSEGSLEGTGWMEQRPARPPAQPAQKETSL